MKLILISICFFATSAWAVHYDLNCQDLENAQLRLKAHTENIVHAAATRHKKKEVVCKHNVCKEKTSNVSRIVYEPGHPDANRRGYVKYPDIDVKEEYKAMQLAASELKSLAYTGACHSRVTESRETLIVKYTKGNILSDIFKFGKNKEITSWARTFVNGKNQIFDFTLRVDRQKFATNSFAL